jgi:hypothetical protein
MRDNSIYGISSIGFDKLTEMTVDGPRNIDLEYFLELHGETYTIKDIEESVQYKMGEAKDKILKSYLQKRRNELMKIWTEE